MTEAVNYFTADSEPYYMPLGDEVEIFRAAYSARLPVLLKTKRYFQRADLRRRARRKPAPLPQSGGRPPTIIPL